MDLALYRGAMLLVYVEVKQRADQLHELIKGIGRYEGYVDLGAPDRGNDSLRRRSPSSSTGPPTCPLWHSALGWNTGWTTQQAVRSISRRTSFSSCEGKPSVGRRRRVRSGRSAIERNGP